MDSTDAKACNSAETGKPEWSTAQEQPPPPTEMHVLGTAVHAAISEGALTCQQPQAAKTGASPLTLDPSLYPALPPLCVVANAAPGHADESIDADAAMLLTKFLRCVVCGNVLVAPVTLACGRSLCRACLAHHATTAALSATSDFRCLFADLTISESSFRSVPYLAKQDKLCNTGRHERLDAYPSDYVLAAIVRACELEVLPAKDEWLLSDALVDSSTATPEPTARPSFDPPTSNASTLSRSSSQISRSSSGRKRIRPKSISLQSDPTTCPTQLHSGAESHQRKRKVKETDDTQNSVSVSIDLVSTPPPVSTLVPPLVDRLLRELECQVCYQLLAAPTTLNCGHTYCRSCVFRTHDHDARCPICRVSLPAFHVLFHRPVNHHLTAILSTFFSEQLSHRVIADRHDQQPSADGTMLHMLPIFVCGVILPGMPTPLHIFEPRYRLMLRRCLANGSNRFGMCGACHEPQIAGGAYREIGTWVDILSVKWLPDGRALIDAVAGERFQVMERCGQLDGYSVARVKSYADLSESLVSWTEPTVMKIYDFMQAMLKGMASSFVNRLVATYGPMPTTDQAAVNTFVSWAAAVLSGVVSEQDKFMLLRARSQTERNELVYAWTQRLRHEWWFSRSGCAVS